MNAQFGDKQLQSFYALTHVARYLLMLLLGATFVGTTGQAIWQLAHPVDSLTGQIVDVAERRVSNGYAIYNIVVRSDQDELHTIRLVNNGRILSYLRDHAESIPSRAVIHHRQGKVTALDLLDGQNLTIRDSRVPPLVRMLIGFVPLLILVFHVRPSLVGRYVGQTEPK